MNDRRKTVRFAQSVARLGAHVVRWGADVADLIDNETAVLDGRSVVHFLADIRMRLDIIESLHRSPWQDSPSPPIGRSEERPSLDGLSRRWREAPDEGSP